MAPYKHYTSLALAVIAMICGLILLCCGITGDPAYHTTPQQVMLFSDAERLSYHRKSQQILMMEFIGLSIFVIALVSCIYIYLTKRTLVTE